MQGGDTVTVELDGDTFDIVHELVLRGLRQTSVTDREYGDAYDKFVDASGGPIRIGDQPDRVKEVWGEIVGGKAERSIRHAIEHDED